MKKFFSVIVLAVLALALMVNLAPAPALAAAPAHAAYVGKLSAPVHAERHAGLADGLSFSLDFSGVFSNASQIVNGLFPIFLVPLGITLGIGILGVITKAFSGIIRG